MKLLDEFIKKASDHDGCSSGEYHSAQLIRSLVTHVARCNMKEVLYYAGIATVTEILEVADRGKLEERVRELNPRLLEIAS